MLGFTPFLDGYHDVENQLIDYLRQKAEKSIAMNESVKNDITNLNEFAVYKKSVLEHFLKALGGLPEDKALLEPKVTGVLHKEGYRIEKIIFQSLPGFYVTCNLYLPTTNTPVPAILFACGHAHEAKAYPVYQKVCLDLVANGFAVLSVDPIGQGERIQYFRNGKEEVTRGIFEHTYAGIQCSLLGMSIARYFCWDLIRALDYVCTREEIDSTRLGMTGNSGGGTQTSYMMLLDDRIKAAAPCTYITSRWAYLGTGQAHDMEQNLFEGISHGPAHDDFLASFAPKPVMVGAVESDFFNLEGAVHTVKLARKAYNLFGAEDNIKLTIAPGTHAYVPELREASVNWFRVHLMGLQPDFRTSDPEPYEPKQLYCTETGQILGDFPQATTVHDLLKSELDREKTKNKFNIELLQKTLGHHKSVEPKYPRVIASDLVADGICREKIFFWSEKDIIVSGLFFCTPDAQRDPVLLLLEEGTAEVETAWELISSLLAEGRDVFLFDSRGVGAVASRQLNPNSFPFHFFETEYRLSCDAQMLGTSLVGMQVTDVLRGIEYLLERTGKEKIVLAGRGKGALLATFAAPFVKTSQLRISPLPENFSQIVKKRLYRPERVPLLFGPLRQWDLPDLYQYLKEMDVEIYQQIIHPLGTSL